MKKNKNILLFFTIFIVSNAAALDKKQTIDANNFFEYQNEIGINGSQLLSNLLSLNASTGVNTPFGFHYAYHTNKITYRIGANTYYNKSTDLASSSFNRKELTDHIFGVRLCVEKHVAILPKLNLHIGMDAFGQNAHAESIIDQQFFTSSNLLSFGGGPAARFIFKINKNINIMSESTLYGSYGFKETRVQLGSPTPEVKNAIESSLILGLPTSLYIQILF